jgi:pimeloyl-ACP methyl ester carboxylesterase
MFSRQTLRKAMLYAASIFIFWNILVAIRAYRFTHFANVPTTNIANAGMWDYTIQRLGGSIYYKTPVKNLPNVTFENVELQTANNLKLVGWYMPVANNKGTIIVLHGFGGNRESILAESYGLQQMGYNILTMDFRAHGNSEGSKCTLGLQEAEDVKLAYEFIKAKGEKNIILYGASMGAASIANCLQQYNTVQPNKVVLDMPFENYELLVEKYFRTSKYPAQPTFTLFTFWTSVFNKKWFFDMKPSNYVKSIKCPVLLQWGANDELVPESSTNKIFENITAPKQLVIYKDCGHESFCKKENALWQQNVATFLAN